MDLFISHAAVCRHRAESPALGWSVSSMLRLGRADARTGTDTRIMDHMGSPMQFVVKALATDKSAKA